MTTHHEDETTEAGDERDDGWELRSETKLRALLAEALVAYDVWGETPSDSTVAWNNRHGFDVIVETGSGSRRINAKHS